MACPLSVISVSLFSRETKRVEAERVEEKRLGGIRWRRRSAADDIAKKVRLRKEDDECRGFLGYVFMMLVSLLSGKI